MRVSLLSSAAVALAMLAGGCTIQDPTGMEDTAPYEELGQAVDGVVCAPDPDGTGSVATVACSDPNGTTAPVYTSLYRVGRNTADTAFSEVAQKFKPTGNGLPGRVRAKLRSLRNLEAGDEAMLYVDIRPVDESGNIGDASTTFARGYVQVSTLSRGMPDEEEISLSQVGSTSVLLDSTKTYAMVFRIGAGPTVTNGVAYVGVASHKSTNPYSDGVALRRTGNTTDPGNFSDQGYLPTLGDYDLSFSLSVNDGGAPPACWSTSMVWGVSMWTADDENNPCAG